MSHRDFTNVLGVAARLDADAMARSSAGLPPDFYARDPVCCTNPECRKLTYGATLAGYRWRDCCQTCIDGLFDEFKANGERDERLDEEDPEPEYLEMDGPIDTRDPGYTDRERVDGLDD